jgi:hypothetical protein
MCDILAKHWSWIWNPLLSHSHSASLTEQVIESQPFHRASLRKRCLFYHTLQISKHDRSMRGDYLNSHCNFHNLKAEYEFRKLWMNYLSLMCCTTKIEMNCSDFPQHFNMVLSIHLKIIHGIASCVQFSEKANKRLTHNHEWINELHTHTHTLSLSLPLSLSL